MTLVTKFGLTVLTPGLAFIVACITPASGSEVEYSQDDGYSDVDGLGEKGLATSNGLATINGLTTVNGLLSANGLTSNNGLSIINGLTTINGLATKGGLPTFNGRWVNCYGKSTATCAAPDGLLSRKTGLMKDQAGADTASYLIRCALPSTSYLTIRRWDSTFVTFQGSAGLAPEWETGQCDTTCQERVSACLLALVNGSGAHIGIELSAANMPTLGGGHFRPYAEAVFYGNVFLDPPQAYMAAHHDYAYMLANASQRGTRFNTYLMARSCSNLSAISFSEFVNNQTSCPIRVTGAVRQYAWAGAETGKCDVGPSTDGMRGVAIACSGPNSTVKSWTNPITTYRNQDLFR